MNDSYSWSTWPCCWNIDRKSVSLSIKLNILKHSRWISANPRLGGGLDRFSFSDALGSEFKPCSVYKLTPIPRANTSGGRNVIPGRNISSWRRSFGLKICPQKRGRNIRPLILRTKFWGHIFFWGRNVLRTNCSLGRNDLRTKWLEDKIIRMKWMY